jgi:energy-coupling factor transport system ATP-binding protein
MPLLDVKGLSYRFNGGAEDFLRSVSFSVEKGEMVAVSGPSGCGKSTLLRCINGIYPHVNGGTISGDILYDGRSIMAMQAERRSTFIGTVFQDFDSQILHLIVEDELAFGPENLGLAKTEITERVHEAAKAVGRAAASGRAAVEY